MTRRMWLLAGLLAVEFREKFRLFQSALNAVNGNLLRLNAMFFLPRRPPAQILKGKGAVQRPHCR